MPDREAQRIKVPCFTDHRGTLSVIDWTDRLPFTPKRFYYIYDVPNGARRAGHAHGVEEQVILALTGSFTVLTDDGRSRREYLLDRRDGGLYIPRMIWVEVYGFRAGSICAVLASHRYDQGDYIRDYDQFLQARRAYDESFSQGDPRYEALG